jgi:sugar/nucleoside kinase (ribokinase family)
VTFIGAVGVDALGHFVVRSELEGHGLNLSIIETSQATGVVVAVVAPDGQRAMLTSKGANDELRFDASSVLDEASPDHVHVSGYSLLNPHRAHVGSRVDGGGRPSRSRRVG